MNKPERRPGFTRRDGRRLALVVAVAVAGLVSACGDGSSPTKATPPASGSLTAGAPGVSSSTRSTLSLYDGGRVVSKPISYSTRSTLIPEGAY